MMTLLERAEQEVTALRARLKTAIKTRNAIAHSMKERCTAILLDGWQCAFTMPKGQRVCNFHLRYERMNRKKATRGDDQHRMRA